MSSFLLRERVFDSACFVVGRIAQASGFKPGSPFVIIGTGRTGTNLLEKILRSHRGISVFPGEANELWHPRLEPFDSSLIDVPPIEIDPRLFSEVSTANWPVNHKLTIRSVFAGFHLATGLSKTLVTKSAMLSFVIPQILEVWPDAKFIHQYRFGLAVVDSYFKKNYGKYTHYVYAEKEYRTYCAKYWNACILEIEKRKQDLSLDAEGKLFEFSYESLCQNPNSTLSRLAHFMEIDANGFSFDVAGIANQNYKTVNYINDPEGMELLDVMSPGLKLKGYSIAEVSS
jgi:hypothetical protein